MERRAGATQVVVATLLLVVSVGALIGVPSPVADDRRGVSTTSTDLGEFVRADEDGIVDREVSVVAELEPGTDVPQRFRKRDDITVTAAEDDRRLQGTVPLSEVRGLSDTRGVAGVRIDTSDIEADNDPTAPGVASVGAATLHERGVTGENVTVGVIDGGFRLSNPAIADQVGAYRAFGDTGDGLHGTVVADVVSDTAPDAELHLAAVGPTTNRREYRRAVQWLRASGADVVVDAGSYLGRVEGVREVADGAADDVAFVTSTGNYAQRHWSGVHRPVSEETVVVGDDDREAPLADGGEGRPTVGEWLRVGGDRPGGLFGGGGPTAREWVRFDGDRRNHLGDGAVAGRVTLSATWGGDGDYDLYLVRQTDAGEVVWAQSTEDAAGREQLSTVVPRGRYAVAVGYDGGAHGETDLEVFASHRLATTTPASSLTAPATAEGVIAVGAADDQGTGAATFSSRGPTPGGGHGVDLVAPDDGPGEGGTSFAAPYAAGTVALLKSEYPSVETTRVGTVVAAAAEDVGPTGVDAATGHGRLDALAAASTLETLVAVGTQPPAAPSVTGGTD